MEKFFTVTHASNPIVALVSAFDIYDAARKYTRLVETDLQSEIVGGEVLEVQQLVAIPADGEHPASIGWAEEYHLVWDESVRNFAIKEEE